MEELEAITEAITSSVGDWHKRIAPSVPLIRKVASQVAPLAEAGYYLNPFQPDGLHFYTESNEMAKNAIDTFSQFGFSPVRISLTQLSDPETTLVKVAYSSAIRNIGETLNFFPGQHFGFVPNYANPLTATLTSGLVGAGAGYGLSKLLQFIAPERYGKNLPKTGLILGGLLGAAPGIGWGAYNAASGKPLLSNELFNSPPPGPDYKPAPVGVWDDPNYQEPDKVKLPKIIQDNLDDPGKRHKAPPKLFGGTGPLGKIVKSEYVELTDFLESVPERIKEAFDTFGFNQALAPNMADVNLNSLGQTLWRSDISPQGAAMTMGTMFAAQQLPDTNSRPGVVTGNQLGQLALNAAGNYMDGVLAGTVINKLIGTPYTRHQIGAANAAVGLISDIIPKLFGN